MSQKIILLSGKKGSGKDTLAEFLKPRFSRASFADPLYQEVQEAYLLDSQELLRDRVSKEAPSEELCLKYCRDLEFVSVMLAKGFKMDTPLSPRVVLQNWGTDYRQAKDGSNYWVDKLIDLVKARPFEDFCVPDMRFPHEYTGLLEYSWDSDADLVCVRILRESGSVSDETSSHISENALDGFDIFDFTITNSEGSPELMAEQFWQKV